MARDRSRSPVEFAGKKLPHQFISTWNNYTDEDVEKFKSWCAQRTRYSAVGREVGKQGTPHLQGFHQTSGNLNFKAFKTKFNSVHVQPVGVDNGASQYPFKEGNLAFEVGEFEEKKPGKRTDLESVAKMAASGCTMREIADVAPTAIVQYGAGLNRLLSLYEKPRDRTIPKRVCVLFGATGTGKTRRVYDWMDAQHPGQELYLWEPSSEKWFDGYSGHKHVLFDEFRGQLPLGMLLRLLDRYPCRVQYKGGSCQFVPDYVYITSPKSPTQWYNDFQYDRIDQLMRRIEYSREIKHDSALFDLFS